MDVVEHDSGNVAATALGHDPERTALISRNRMVSYGELESLTASARGRLRSMGVVDGDRIAIVTANGVPFVVTYLAALGMGAVVVPLNPTSPSIELGRQIDIVGAKVVGWTAPRPPRGGASTIARSPRSPVWSPSTTMPCRGAMAWDDFVDHDPDAEIVTVEPDHLAALMFTSGTAGSPRAACSPTATCSPTSVRPARRSTPCRRTTWCTACCRCSTSSA